MSSRAQRTVISLALGLCVSMGTAHAVCPTAPFFIDLKTGLAGTIGGPNAQISLIGAIANSPVAGCAGWKEAVLKVNVAGCTQAILVAEYEGLPKGWSLNVGDSPTNDGFAGDAGSTANDAEMWILDESMAVANNGSNPDNPLFRQDLSLTNSSMKFVVKNQFLSWGQPYGVLQSPNSKQLFALPDTSNAAEASNLYVGLNRVVSNAPANGRRGCGLRRMLVVLQ
jgi:hypothetical protein